MNSEKKVEAAHPSAGQSDASLPAESLARAFHEVYERLAPSFGYETRKESTKPWEQVPEHNRKLMIAVCNEVMAPRLAESRAAMREECAKVVQHIPVVSLPDILDAIRSLPADASALDARDARVREEALEEAAKMVEQYNSELVSDWNNVRLRPNLQTRIRALAKRSAEKGKGE
jgi:hypothetical protein